jgi:hypothetical protein
MSPCRASAALPSSAAALVNPPAAAVVLPRRGGGGGALLARHGDLDGLRARIDVGDEHAASRLAELMIDQGRGEEAERPRRFGLNLDGSIACA